MLKSLILFDNDTIRGAKLNMYVLQSKNKKKIQMNVKTIAKYTSTMDILIELKCCNIGLKKQQNCVC